ncbi:uncharacterized protein B0I36DRAFT_130022 [Microdochium trichocladiopsis]|uniref:Uncharacterized protein n=1 Tax=Microdochium trichocladiopsis TaxID=1682393 RepID=A0A9P8Y3X4_9PEZI|nr:uncharacterized protein B0I36DRAFT_130022 [Microdochium trichocladiopsis]KAH7029268.1 hypothetical protein B0I36DRAFT_130022 [Microdochium trichocladiopsis]
MTAQQRSTARRRPGRRRSLGRRLTAPDMSRAARLKKVSENPSFPDRFRFTSNSASGRWSLSLPRKSIAIHGSSRRSISLTRMSDGRTLVHTIRVTRRPYDDPRGSIMCLDQRVNMQKIRQIPAVRGHGYEQCCSRDWRPWIAVCWFLMGS